MGHSRTPPRTHVHDVNVGPVFNRRRHEVAGATVDTTRERGSPCLEANPALK
jgi:hypothetical protein